MALDIRLAKRTERRRFPSKKHPQRMLGYTIYYFDCVGCGSEINTMHGYAKKHSSRCGSCAQKKGNSPYYAAYQNLIRCSRQRNLLCSITADQYDFFRNQGACHYCAGEVPKAPRKGDLGYRGYFLDRKDNAQGYSFENCVLCCWQCNQAKGDRFSYREWSEMVKTLKYSRLGQIWASHEHTFRKDLIRPDYSVALNWDERGQVSEGTWSGRFE